MTIANALPEQLVLTPVGRWPTRLSPATTESILSRPLPRLPVALWPGQEPQVSIIVITHNQLVFTRLCLESLLSNTSDVPYEVIVVDNGSTDGTPDYLRALARCYPSIHTVCNPHNAGFAAANNQALAVARGKVFVLLNNDTIVPPGWIGGLLRHLGDPAIGMVGPVTNNTCNEAKIAAYYRTYGEFLQFARACMHTHHGQSFAIRMLAMFCVALRREVYQVIGPLDERFTIGTYEDDDYAMRVAAAGYRIACAEDVFVHHAGQATFGIVGTSDAYQSRLQANRSIWEHKWARPWNPHQTRQSPDYHQLVQRIRRIARCTLPDHSTILVISKGDDCLLDLDCGPAWHFPQLADGRYAGHYPATSHEAITHLEELRARGGSFLLIPASSLWWLEHYRTFHEHLETRYHFLVHQQESCAIVALQPDTYHTHINETDGGIV